MTDSSSLRAVPRPRPGSPPQPRVPRPDRYTLPNGLRVVVVERDGLPQLAARMVVPAGSAVDPQDGLGLAALTGSLLTEGAAALAPNELHARIDGLGAALSTRVSQDFTEIDVSLLAETLEEGLGLMADVIVRPAFDEREFERGRAETLDALDARLDEPANVADDRISEALFGADHPYGRLALGTPESIAAATREQAIDFHRLRYRPGGSTLIVAGDLDAANLRATLERAFAGWEGEAPPLAYPPVPDLPRAAGELRTYAWEHAAQAEIRVAGIGMRRDSEDWIPAAVANYLLGGSTITGRLGANLREDKGWTYGIRSGFAPGLQPAGWLIETAVGAENAADALAEIAEELRRMVEEPVDDDELERAKEALILSLPRAFETPGRIVSRLATLEAYDLSHEYWEAFPDRVRQVDAETVSRLSRKYFAPDTLARVEVGVELPTSPPGR